MHHTYYIVFQMHRKIPLIAIFLGQAFILLHKPRKCLLKITFLNGRLGLNLSWSYSKTPTYLMQYLCCTRNFEMPHETLNDALFCEELTWNHECFFLFLEHSVSEKMEIISTEEQNAMNTKNFTDEVSDGTCRNWVPKSHSQHCVLISSSRSLQRLLWTLR